MPPRPAKKAVAKRPSPKVKGATPPASSKHSPEAPFAIVEEKMDPEAEAVPETSVKEEAISPAPKSAVRLEVAGEKVGEEVATEEGQDSADPALEAAESVKDHEVSAGDKVADDGENKMDVDEDAKKAEQKTGVADGDGNVEGDDELSGGDNSGSDEENEEDDPSLYMVAPLTDRKKQKEFEIFVGRLDKEAAEDDLIKVFSVFGEIQSVRIVKHPSTQKSKGFAFIRYATTEHAKKALAELKDGTEIRGRRARVSASQDNDTLYLGNICKTWTKDHVIEILKGLGVEQIEHILLPDDPKNEGKIKGFAFLEYSSHSDAMAAFQRLRKPDAVFGCDRSAKVAFATSLHPSEETLLQVKTVYVEGIPVSWDEEKVKEVCEQYGEIETVQLSRNFTKTKRKDFGFVEFCSREGAVACVEGINNAQLGEGETKVKANLAKPQNKGRLAKQGARGGFKVTKDGEVTEEAVQSKKRKNAKSKEVLDKGNTQSKLKNSKGSKPSNSESKVKASKSQDKVTEGKNGSQAEQPFKGKKRGGRGVDAVTNVERPSKKARKNNNYGKMHGRPSNGFGNQRNTYSGMPKVNYVAHPTTYAPSYAPSATSYHAYAGTSGSNRRHSDLEPHAGYIPAAKQVQNPYGNDQRRADAYINQPSSGSGYARAVSAIQPSYPGYPSYAGYEGGYAYPSSGAYAPRRAYY